MNVSVPIISAVIGVVVLLFGRKLFWLCVAAIGFAAAVELAPHLTHEPTPVLALTFALVLGLVGALLALFLQKLAIALAGFLAGGRLALGLVATFFVQYESYYLLTFLIGGLIGAILLLALFDWALILVSSLIGAHLISKTITLPSTGSVLLFAALVICGVIIQTTALRSKSAVAND
jgi:hypothetical protein